MYIIDLPLAAPTRGKLDPVRGSLRGTKNLDALTPTLVVTISAADLRTVYSWDAPAMLLYKSFRAKKVTSR